MENEALLALQLDRFLRRHYSIVRSEVPSLSEKQGRYIQSIVLYVISKSGPLSVGEVVASLSRDKSQVSRMIQELLKLGMLEKSQRSNDARTLILASTSKGDQQAKEIGAALESSTNFMMNGLSPDERERFCLLLSKIDTDAF